MGVVALVQGFKLDVAKLDEVLAAAGIPPTGRSQPFSQETSVVAELCKTKGADCEIRIFMPLKRGYSLSSYVFICFDWVYVHNARDIEGLLQKPVPAAFEAIRKSLQAESGISKYIVCNDDDTTWIPEELIARNTPPVHCGVCDAVFDNWTARFFHRRNQHGIDEDREPLPDC
ncbi:uncharacterized protein BDZ99DRAFT_112779 [Mytilinidion resinicola]|uniref:C2H2-type domain-containing protein n=1 Tax=Mytilinidion resinicola TaxID=574789 RepID=A0A6A6YAQ4_9PEZI|nr:uncharacterized protein BDZ99DRAFT_112779 [Mytilinidion resinicola]KAF2805084.1 hypothetical protein BDZ99DRAFT_112779 [Mytilinidion resinicola]